MIKFLQEVSDNIDEFYWTENNAPNLKESRMGAQSSDCVVFKVFDEEGVMGATFYDGDSYQTMAEKPYSLDTPEGKLISKIYYDSRGHIIDSNKKEETKLINRYHELVAASEYVIRKHFT